MSRSVQDFVSALLSDVDDAGLFMLCGFAEGGRPAVATYWPSDENTPASVASEAFEWQDQSAYNVYWGAALMRDGLEPGRRGGTADVVAMLAIVVDLDDVAAAASWREKLAPYGLAPSYVIRTSATPNPRYQLVFQFKQPVTDIEAWQSVARRIEAHLGADWCSKDPAHVWRMPGTINYPNTKKRAAGRLSEYSHLVEANDVRFSLADFDVLPVPADEPAPQQEIPLPQPSAVASKPWTYYGDIVGLLPQAQQKRIICGEPLLKAGQPDRSAWDFSIICDCVRAGLTLGDVQSLYLLGQAEIFADKFRGKELARPGGGIDYLAKTYVKAQRKVATEPPPIEEDDEPFPMMDDEPAPNEDDTWAAMCLPADKWSEMEEREPHYFIAPWLSEGAIHMVHGASGDGKSYFLMHTLYNLALGKTVGPFRVERPARVLYLDMEMSTNTNVARCKAMRRSYGPDPEGNFQLFSPFFAPPGQERPPELQIDLRNVWTQQRIKTLAQRHRAEVVVIDNVRSASPGMDENERAEWDGINDFLKSLRNLGFTVVWVHHDRKNKEDQTYAGSANAITATEIVLQVKRLGQSQIDQMNAGWGEVTEGDGSVKNAIRLSYDKHREMDPSIHRPINLAYVYYESVGAAELKAGIETMDRMGLLRLLSTEEQCWALAIGRYDGMPKSLREIAAFMVEHDFPAHPSFNTVARYVRKIESDPAAQARARRLLPTVADEPTAPPESVSNE